MDLGVLRDISLLWLILLALITVLPFGILFYYGTKGMRRLRQLALLYLPIAQEKAKLVADTTEQISDKVVEPIISTRAKAAQAQGLAGAILTRREKA